MVLNQAQRKAAIAAEKMINHQRRMIVSKTVYAKVDAGDEIYVGEGKYDVVRVKDAGDNWDLQVWEDEFENENENELLNKKGNFDPQKKIYKSIDFVVDEAFKKYRYDLFLGNCHDLKRLSKIALSSGYPQLVFHPPGCVFI